MNALRRGLVVLGLTGTVVLVASIPASAAYSDVVQADTAISTLTVAAPSSITVNRSCTTATTVVRRTVYTDPTTGVQTQTAYSSTTTYAASSGNVNSYTSSTVAGPGLNETTTTTTTKSTTLAVTASWPASTTTRGVAGYLVNAHLSDGSVYPMAQTAAGTLSTSASVDAGALAYQPRISVTTLTSYGWTATTAQTAVLTC